MKTALLLALMAVAALAQLGPGQGEWQRSKPEQEGLSTDALQGAADSLHDVVHDRECYLVVKNGKLVFDEYYDGFREDQSRHLYSVSKTLISTLVGTAVQHYDLDVQRLLEEFVDHPRAVPGSTIEHVLTMTTRYAPPGSQFEYDTIGLYGLNYLTRIVANVTGQEPDDFMQEWLVHTLGLQDFWWPPGPDGNLIIGAWSSCRDLARVGQLWLNQGAWAGVGQVMSAEYIRKGSTHVFPDAGPEDGYGYLVWLREETVMFSGMYGQCVLIDPASQTVVVSTGNSVEGEGCGTVWELSKDAVRGGVA